MAGGWKIDPMGVQSVLETVRQAQTEIAKDLASGELEPVARAVTMPAGNDSAAPNAMSQNGLSGSVMSALNTLFQSETDNIATIQAHILAGLYGVANATYEYAVAHESMADVSQRYAKAADMQEAMFEAASSGDLSYFTEHGQYSPTGER